MEKIKNFEELISDYIGTNKTIVDTKVSNLLAPGENYLSDIVKIDIVVKDKVTNNNKDVHLVAKLVTDNVIGPTFNLTKNEVYFYKNVIPVIKSFHKRHGLPAPLFYPDFAGGRISLKGDDGSADTDAILVLENLVVKGYMNMDRHVGFDMDTTKLILKDLATFHAAPLAMRLLEPEEFVTATKNLSNPFFADSKEKEHREEPELPIIKILIDYFNADKKKKHVVVKLTQFRDFLKSENDLGTNPIKPFSTIVHNDLWLNNIMQKLVRGVTVRNKFVDFQLCEVNSLVNDLILFLFSSVEWSCLEYNVDHLIKFYHEEFVFMLKKLNVYTDEYSYDKLLEEFKTCGKKSIVQSMMMIPTIIFAEKGKAHNLGSSLTLEDVPPMALKKLILLCEVAAEKNWF